MAGDAFSIFTAKSCGCFRNNLDKGGKMFVAKQREKVELRYYVIPETEVVLALLGEDWIRESWKKYVIRSLITKTAYGDIFMHLW